MPVRTRFAPSPTGYMHIGNLRTALYAYLFARGHDGEFIVRLEDTDRDRLVKDADEVIYRTLREAGLNYDEGPDIGGPAGPYVQSERKDLYAEYAKKLVDAGAAYYCFCTKERLAELRREAEAKGEQFCYDGHCARLSKEEVEAKLAAGEPYVIRQKIPDEGESTYEDLVFGTVRVPNADMEDGILLKSDGYPTYNLANVIDDHLMGITHVIRGSEYLSSTPKYNLLYEALGWEPPKYAHLPPVMRDKQRKLSKRDGAVSYEDFVEKGYLPEAIINYIALLGWAPTGVKGTQEIFTLPELVEAFDIKDVSKAPAIFDESKLRWMNGEHIRRFSEEEFIERARPYIAKVVDPDSIDLSLLTKMIQARLEMLPQIPEKIAFLAEMPPFDFELYNNKKMKVTPEGSYGYLKTALQVLEGMVEFDEAYVHDALMNLVQRLGIKNGQLLYPLRIALTNTAVTPGGAIETAVLLGPKETLRRLRRSIADLEHALTERGIDPKKSAAVAADDPAPIRVAPAPAAAFGQVRAADTRKETATAVHDAGVRRILKEGFPKEVAQKLHPEFSEAELEAMKVELDARGADADPVPESLTAATPHLSFNPKLYANDELKVTPGGAVGYLKAAYPLLAGLETWSHVYVEDALWQLIRELGIEDKQLLYPLSVALTNTEEIPDGSYALVKKAVRLGQEETLDRIAHAVRDLMWSLTEAATQPESDG